VVASRLRAKLAEYYTQEGAKDPVFIAIPKGSYSIVSSYPAQDAPTPPSVEAPPVVEAPTSRQRWVVVGAIAALGIAAGFLPGYWAGRKSVSPDFSKSYVAFWSHFLKGEPPILVFSNSRFVGIPSNGMRLAGRATDGQPDGPINTQFTGVGEVFAVREIAHQLNLFGKDGRVKRAQLFTWDDARSSDLILIGGQEQNRAMAQLPPLEKFNLKADSEEPYLLRAAVRNETPIPGKEQPYYFPGAIRKTGSNMALWR
jgi:hypothetical protein